MASAERPLPRLSAMDWAELSRPALPAAPAEAPDASRPHKESWEAWGEDSTGAPSSGSSTSSAPSAKLDLRLPLAFSLLCFASVSMTLGNKWLMTRPTLRPHTELVITVHL